MKRLVWMIVLMISAFSPFGHAQTHISAFDFDGGIVLDLTEFLQNVSGFDLVDTVTAVNMVPGEGDELLVVTGENRVALLSLPDFSLLEMVNHDELRQLWGLPHGSGTLSALTSPGNVTGRLLYRDDAGGNVYDLDFKNSSCGIYDGPPLPVGFATGFSFSSVHDTGVLHWDTVGSWFYEPFEGQSVYIDFNSVFRETPHHATELEISINRGIYRFLIAVMPGSAPSPTPTPPIMPTATPTPRPTTNSFDTLVAQGLGRKIWRIDGETYEVEENIANTGLSPNQIVVRGDRFFIVNSQNNSIGIYNSATCELMREIGLGGGQNPFKMAFLNDDLCYVTNLVSNTVSLVRISSGQVETTIAMPDSEELPSDPNETTWARPMGITIVDDTAYVACGNLNDEYIAGGWGVVVEIDTASHTIKRFYESDGRNCVNVYHHDRWPDKLYLLNAGTYNQGSGFIGDGTLAIRSIPEDDLLRIIDLQDSPFELTFGHQNIYFASAMDGYISRLNLSTLTMIAPIELPNAGHGLNFVSGLEIAPNGLLWALEFNHNMLFVLNPGAGDQIIHSIPMGEGPDALAFIEKE